MSQILPNDLVQFIIKECGESAETNILLETIQTHANEIYTCLLPILRSDKDLLIVLRCSKPYEETNR